MKLLLCFVLIYYFIFKLFYFIILSLFTKHLDYISGRGEGVQVQG